MLDYSKVIQNKCKKLAFLDNVTKRRAIARILGHRLTEVMALACPIIHNQLQVVDGDRASDSVTEGLDHVDGSLGGGVFEDDLELGEGQVDVLQVAQELFFGVHHTHVLLVIFCLGEKREVGWVECFDEAALRTEGV